MALKLAGLGCARYWSDGWNCLDGSIVTMSIAEMLLTAYLSGTGVKLSFLRMLRMLRVLRILRLLKNLKGLRDLVMTLVFAFPALINVSCLLGLVI